MKKCKCLAAKSRLEVAMLDFERIRSKKCFCNVRFYSVPAEYLGTSSIYITFECVSLSRVQIDSFHCKEFSIVPLNGNLDVNLFY